jgi:hypothetical protein
MSAAIFRLEPFLCRSIYLRSLSFLYSSVRSWASYCCCRGCRTELSGPRLCGRRLSDRHPDSTAEMKVRARAAGCDSSILQRSIHPIRRNLLQLKRFSRILLSRIILQGVGVLE